MLRMGAFIVAGSLVATAAHAQLLSERVEGAARICRYAPTGLASPRQVIAGNATDLEARLREDADRRGSSHVDGAREVPIDASRTCPSTFPDQQEARIIVPSFATLDSERRVNGDLVCVYRYLDRRYAISLGQRSICPYTPAGVAY